MLNDAKKNGYERERQTRQGRAPLNRVLRREQIRDRHGSKQQLRQTTEQGPLTDE